MVLGLEKLVEINAQKVRENTKIADKLVNIAINANSDSVRCYDAWEAA